MGCGSSSSANVDNSNSTAPTKVPKEDKPVEQTAASDDKQEVTASQDPPTVETPTVASSESPPPPPTDTELSTKDRSEPEVTIPPPASEERVNETVKEPLAEAAPDATTEEAAKSPTEAETLDATTEMNIPIVADPEPDTEEAAVQAPTIKKGYVMKQGHKHKNWKNRYFVLNEGKITYFENPADKPPYGTTQKGEMTLENVEISRSGTLLTLNKNNPSPFKGVLIRNSSKHSSNNLTVDGDGQEGHMVLVLDIKYANEREEWAKAIQEHIDYINKKYNNN